MLPPVGTVSIEFHVVLPGSFVTAYRVLPSIQTAIAVPLALVDILGIGVVDMPDLIVIVLQFVLLASLVAPIIVFWLMPPVHTADRFPEESTAICGTQVAAVA